MSETPSTSPYRTDAVSGKVGEIYDLVVEFGVCLESQACIVNARVCWHQNGIIYRRNQLSAEDSANTPLKCISVRCLDRVLKCI